jgi:hypothetical protein
VEVEVEANEEQGKPAAPKFTPVAFHEDCVKRVQKKLGVSLVKRTRAGYSSPDNETAIICSVSKEHNPESNPNYWFAFHPHQQEFLASYAKKFMVFGCGSSKRVILVPYDTFKPWLEGSWTTTNEGRTYWHVVIYRKGEQYTLRLRKGQKPVGLTSYLLEP